MRILIANPFGIGDVLFSLPLVQAIRAQIPQAFIGYLGNRRTEELVSVWPELDWHRPFEFRAAWRRSRTQGWQDFRRMVHSIRAESFDVLLDLSLGWQVGWIALAAGIRRRIGFDYRNRGRFLSERATLSGFHRQPIPEEYLDLLPKIGLTRPFRTGLRFDLPASVQSQAKNFLHSCGIGPTTRLLGIVPGGGASWGENARFKRWAPERFAEVGDRLALSRGLKPILFGDDSEGRILREAASRMNSQPLIVSPALSLLPLAGLLQRCRLVLGNDSGPLHLACAVGTPTLSIFGPVDASVYGPYPPGGQERFHPVAVHGLACRPCYRNFRFPPCPWDNACLKKLETEPVLQAADELLR